MNLSKSFALNEASRSKGFTGRPAPTPNSRALALGQGAGFGNGTRPLEAVGAFVEVIGANTPPRRFDEAITGWGTGYLQLSGQSYVSFRFRGTSSGSHCKGFCRGQVVLNDSNHRSCCAAHWSNVPENAVRRQGPKQLPSEV